jgi:thymidylate kinase
MTKKKLICLCGPDGSGKTTLSKDIVKIFASLGEATSYKHAHGYKISKNSFGHTASTVKKFRYLYSLLIPLAYIDNLLTYFLSYRSSVRVNHLILDRYFYDKYCRLRFYGIANSLITKLVAKILPKPDLAILLLPPPELCLKRKAEYSLEEYTKFNNIYLEMSEYVDFVTIDTSLPASKTFKKLESSIKKIL